MIENGTYKARTHQGLEHLLEAELEKAGASYLFKTDGAIQFKAEDPILYNFLIHTYVCISLEILLSQPFDINETELSTLAESVNWPNVIPLESVFKVEAMQDGEVSRKLSVLAKGLEEDIQNFYEHAFGQSPKIADAEHEAEFVVNLHVDQNGSCYLALEAGGISLRYRGKSDIKNGGVISPALAAGLIHLSGWDTESTFIDPYAGNGVLLIEAARIAKNRTPAFDNDAFLMKQWRTFRHALWKKTREAILPEIRKDVKWIYGSERRKALFTRLHDTLRKVRLNDNISVRHTKADDIFYPEKAGIIITAPPLDADPNVLEEFVRNTKRYAHNYKLGLFTQLHNLDSMVNMKPESVTKITFEGREFSYMLFSIFNPKKRTDDATGSTSVIFEDGKKISRDNRNTSQKRSEYGEKARGSKRTDDKRNTSSFKHKRSTDRSKPPEKTDDANKRERTGKPSRKPFLKSKAFGDAKKSYSNPEKSPKDDKQKGKFGQSFPDAKKAKPAPKPERDFSPSDKPSDETLKPFEFTRPVVRPLRKKSKDQKDENTNID